MAHQPTPQTVLAKRRQSLKTWTSSTDDTMSGTSNPAKKAPAKKATSPKVKQSFSIDKTLDLVGGGVTYSFKQFVEEKKPTNMVEKCLISVYWLAKETKARTPATVDQVYTCFKDAGWVVPNDLVNTLQQAGTKGWLDTKKRDDMKVVVGGENHVEHDMPAKPKDA